MDPCVYKLHFEITRYDISGCSLAVKIENTGKLKKLAAPITILYVK